VWFIIGDQDFLLDGAQRAAEAWAECGNDVDFQLVPGVDHQIIASRLPPVFEEMADSEHPCMIQPDPPGEPDAGPDPVFVDAAIPVSGDAGIDDEDPGAELGPLTGGCSAAPERRGGSAFLLALAFVLWFLRRRGNARFA
jgi:uncharacterized protein (TIGR03382 family)